MDGNDPITMQPKSDAPCLQVRINFDILINMFSFLPREDLVRCAGVCQQWREDAYNTSLWKNFVAKFWNEDSFNKLTVESLVERQISSVKIGWHPYMSSRVQQNIKLTKLFTKCSTNPAVKCLIIEDWEIQDDIRDHLPDRSETLECLKLSPGLSSKHRYVEGGFEAFDKLAAVCD